MSREVRKVPPSWEHPRDERGMYIPLYDSAIWFFFSRDPHLEMPSKDKFMPYWRSGVATHYMMFETIDEGTPMSPAFETAEELASWLTDNGANWSGGDVASYDAWLALIVTPPPPHWFQPGHTK